MEQQIIQEILRGGKEISGFIVNNFPNFSEQIIRRGLFSNWIGLFIGIILGVLSFYLFKGFRKYCFNKDKNSDYWSDWDAISTINTAVFLILELLLLLGILMSMFELVQIYSAPSTYIVEYLASLIKKAKGYE